ncbi:amino acid adenylation domain-containing protein [Kitasatospora sp. NBC_00240]|uniref:amino acid adenylation domain-containing protein n=1 Tax=Kitasatospora sp. NBC_00240 TaxID=2903567 RepID=UPI00225C1AC9|nr:amino acid adenylation domain-containing protein [Kitasatospora sp. NBC_00240]MCX5207886.1 amino acid adenylation domain-containing protein [Kitasatospora sp. NBC_00240]
MSTIHGIHEVSSDLIDVFTESAIRHPHRPALVHQGRVVSYRGLHELVNTLAGRLGDSPGVVAVSATHTPETVVGLLGVLAAGGVYCPVDPAFPFERRQAMVTAAGCRTMLAADSGPATRLGLVPVELGPLAELPPNPPEMAPTSNSPSHRAGSPAAADTPRLPAPGRTGAGAEDPAYILFTSGSTGQPKPVVTPRRAISATVHSLRGLFGLMPEDRVLQFASLNWDTCFEEILPALTAGAALVLDPEAHSGSFPRFLRMVERERITVLDLPTAFWHELVLHLAEDGLSLPGCVRVLVIGGEAASPARLADWSRLDTGRIRLVNTYGCTETTLITHAVDLHGPQAPSPGRAWDGRTKAPIGRALPHVVQRIGEQGELIIGGPAVALGYLGLPQATDERFTLVDGERCFRTGDRVSSTPDGVLTHQGRLDGEIKIRGIRVDPAEVEAHLSSHPSIQAVAVVAATLAGRSALVAYVVPRAQARAEGLDTEVLSYLRGRVPGHLVPSRITVVPELVLTASGKVDRAGSHRRHTPPEQVKGDLR